MRRVWLLVTAVLLSGCGQLGYLSQSLSGHLRLMSVARPVDDWLAQQDPSLAVTPQLRERLVLSQRIRYFATASLHLPDNRSYRRYADLKRGAAVWNVVATPALSLTLTTSCFPVMGCVGYRGFFDRAAADAHAKTLRDQGLDVMVYGVPAYSTLGWSNWIGGDPLLNTFINYPEGELAQMIFHELAHQVAYAADDTAFNEAFATSVERLGAQAWLQSQASPAAQAEYRAGLARRERFRALTHHTREQLAALYASPLDDAAKRAAKATLLQQLREQQTASADRAYDGWIDRANNASFALLSAYADLSPAFEVLFKRLGSDWPRFYTEVQRLAALPKPERRAQLESTRKGD